MYLSQIAKCICIALLNIVFSKRQMYLSKIALQYIAVAGAVAAQSVANLITWLAELPPHFIHHNSAKLEISHKYAVVFSSSVKLFK